jgi:hypothetical protein
MTLHIVLLTIGIIENISGDDELKSIAKTSDIDDLELLQSRVVNKHDFFYILNPEHRICHEKDSIFLLVYVHSAPANFKRRLSMRETWAKRSLFRDMRLVFMMGSVVDPKINERLLLENGLYKDIVQENFVDSYKNLTYKGKKKVFMFYPKFALLSFKHSFEKLNPKKTFFKMETL